ncbi:ACT domain-containing protein [Lactobacillus sp. CC-MHH1034]|uniref:ACT domain-containing protein n=1 Tax=Agrilactobacillus fermenti TaxID=2586909 RepID=UPI001E48FC6D|nr:ACT domain-containing protein [Agrilactobacillus fermenti]MCD2255716.1 ACT domain-containing protein [Agrilactobacillus fermenti]
MKIVITVIGQDQIGIVAKVSRKLADLKVNILDISQTLMQTNFTMILMGEIKTDTPNLAQIQTELKALGTEIGVVIRVQRSEVFDAIQKL